MWWHGGEGLTERSERGSLSAVATHDVFGVLGGDLCAVAEVIHGLRNGVTGIAGNTNSAVAVIVVTEGGELIIKDRFSEIRRTKAFCRGDLEKFISECRYGESNRLNVSEFQWARYLGQKINSTCRSSKLHTGSPQMRVYVAQTAHGVMCRALSDAVDALSRGHVFSFTERQSDGTPTSGSQR
jgi:hypothetical protein